MRMLRAADPGLDIRDLNFGIQNLFFSESVNSHIYEDRQKANLLSVVSIVIFLSKEGKADILNFDEFEGKIKPTTVHLSKTKFEKTSCDVI